MKKCTLCHKEKPFSDFSIARREKDGLQHRCKSCNSVVAAQYRTANKEKERMRHAKYHAENKNKINARISKWQKENLDKCRSKSKRFYEQNREKECRRKRAIYWKNPEKERERSIFWRQNNIEHRKQYDDQNFKNNKGKIYAKAAKRRSLKKKAIPLWANFSKIQAIYDECVRISRKTGIEHHVDHIIPLTSKFICGLHCEANLQILTASENSRKNNKFSPYSY